MSHSFLLDIIVAEHDITLMSLEPRLLSEIELQIEITIGSKINLKPRHTTLIGNIDDQDPPIFFIGLEFQKNMKEQVFNDILQSITKICDLHINESGFGCLKLQVMLDVLKRSGFSVIRNDKGAVYVIPMKSTYEENGIDLRTRTMYLTNGASDNPLDIRPHHLECVIDNANLIVSSDRNTIGASDPDIMLDFDSTIAKFYIAVKELNEIKTHWNDQFWFIQQERR